MDDPSNSVYSYYLAHFGQLSPDKRFHFASRLYLWSQDQACMGKLDELRPWFTQQEQPAAAVASVAGRPAVSSKNAATLRQSYFSKYPKLQAYNNALFRINFLQTVYEIDASSIFGELFGQAEPAALFTALNGDHDAVRMLSTHAINFFYLYATLVLHNSDAVRPEQYFEIGRRGYDLHNLTQLQLHIYLYTHCIIGATQFYYRSVPPEQQTVYEHLVSALETLIEARFQDVNLDNKFEFLTCCKLVGYASRLEALIFAEAWQSRSPQGDYLIDTHNNNPQLDNVTLDTSEHRNVLFLLANRDYSPLVLRAASSSR